jgi:5,6-dimethylbenzimidazole synthase
VTNESRRQAFYEHVQHERALFTKSLPAAAAERFSHIKIDGVLESTLSVVVTYDPLRGAPHVLGRHAIADAGLYSVCLAIENLWLAATAEELGVGWVSFYREPFVRGLLGIPESVRPVAWLCVGPVTHLEPVPDLVSHGWRDRLPLSEVVHHECWSASPGAGMSVAIVDGLDPSGLDPSGVAPTLWDAEDGLRGPAGPMAEGVPVR